MIPAERARAEDAENGRLLLGFPGVRVCLHVDRTSKPLPGGGYRIECDYCPSYGEVYPGGTWPDISPRYYKTVRL